MNVTSAVNSHALLGLEKCSSVLHMFVLVTFAMFQTENASLKSQPPQLKRGQKVNQSQHISTFLCTAIGWLGGVVVSMSARDREDAGSTPGWCTIRQQLWASCSHPCASVTKQYNLVPAKGR